MNECTSYLQMFGGLRFHRNGEEPIDIPPRQAGLLLAFLALHPDRAHTREELCARFWPEDGDEESRQKLRHSLHTIRGQLGKSEAPDYDVVITTRMTVQLNVECVRTDVAKFEETLRAAERTESARQRIELFSEALDLYKGDLLPGFYEDSIVQSRSRLEEAHLKALHSLALAYEQNGEPERAAETARRCVALDPLREEIHCDLMRFYAAAGQPSAVLRQYRELECALHDELAAKPAAHTQELRDRFHQEAQGVMGCTAEPKLVNGASNASSNLRSLPRSRPSRLPRRFALASTGVFVIGIVLAGVSWPRRGQSSDPFQNPAFAATPRTQEAGSGIKSFFAAPTIAKASPSISRHPGVSTTTGQPAPTNQLHPVGVSTASRQLAPVHLQTAGLYTATVRPNLIPHFMNAAALPSTFHTASAAATLPVIRSLAPQPLSAYGPGVTLLAFGDHFTASSVIRWNGKDLHTYFHSTQELAADVSRSMIEKPGPVPVTVAESATGASSQPVDYVIAVTSINPQTPILKREAPERPITATLTIANTGYLTASNILITRAELGGVAPFTALPLIISSMDGARGERVTITFRGNYAAPGTKTSLVISGTFLGGEFHSTFDVTLP